VATVRDFVPGIQSYARLCPVATISAEVLDSLGEFCRRGLLWRHVSTNDIAAAVDTYTALTPVGAGMAAIERVEISGSPISLAPMGIPNDGAQARAPHYYSVDHEDAIRLYPMPSENITGGLVVTMFLEPSSVTAVLPDVFLSKHKAAIVSGALARVLAMVGQPWANPELALYHVRNFKAEISKVRIAAIKGQSLGNITIAGDPV
jgi:hypothetical protein